MATVLQRVPLDGIESRAREVTFTRTATAVARALLVVVAAVFFAMGWLAFQPWRAMAWAWAAVVVGWLQARQAGRTPDGGG